MRSPNDPGSFRAHDCKSCGRSVTDNRPLCGQCRIEMARKHREAGADDE